MEIKKIFNMWELSPVIEQLWHMGFMNINIAGTCCVVKTQNFEVVRSAIKEWLYDVDIMELLKSYPLLDYIPGPNDFVARCSGITIIVQDIY